MIIVLEYTYRELSFTLAIGFRVGKLEAVSKSCNVK